MCTMGINNASFTWLTGGKGIYMQRAGNLMLGTQYKFCQQVSQHIFVRCLGTQKSQVISREAENS